MTTLFELDGFILVLYQFPNVEFFSVDYLIVTCLLHEGMLKITTGKLFGNKFSFFLIRKTLWKSRMSRIFYKVYETYTFPYHLMWLNFKQQISDHRNNLWLIFIPHIQLSWYLTLWICHLLSITSLASNLHPFSFCYIGCNRRLLFGFVSFKKALITDIFF